MAKKLFIGLDVGTDSVGWATTDENYKLWRMKGKTAWGARIFGEASDAKTRRQFRTSGRRLARRKERIRLLNAEFDSLIVPKDPTFLRRLEFSAFQNDDNQKPSELRTDCPLFISKAEEKAYYKKYPTIWHLRKALIDNEDDAYSDIRLIYLAIHHIIKYRGNFLTDGDKKIGEFDYSNFGKLNKVISNLINGQESEETVEDGLFAGLPESNYAEFINTVKDRSLGKGEKKKKLLSLMEKTDESKNFLEMYCTLCSGGEYSTSKLNKKGDEAAYGDVKISFNSKYDDEVSTYQDALGEAFDIVDLAKEVFDYADLSNILGENKWLSYAFVNLFESHKQQLRALKDICKTIDAKNGFIGENSLYVKMFNDKDNEKNYVAFTHNGNKKRCSLEDFNKYVIKEISPYADLLDGEDKKNWIGLESFANNSNLLQTIALRSTSVIPMQLHKQELEKILDNAISKGITGFDQSFKDRLIKLFSFKIPYYCGPLTTRSGYSNVAFKGDKFERITPWNFDDVIDLKETKKKFMNGLTNKCTYLKDKDVLPKQSLTYQDYDTWNKLNNLRINGEKPTPEELKDLFDNYVSTRSKTTMKDIKQYLVKQKGNKNQDVTVSGWNDNDSIVCSSRCALSKVFDLNHRNTKDFEIAERIIFLKTIYCDSKKDANEAVHDEFSALSEEQLKIANSLSCKEWSPFSKEFLELRGYDQNGEITTPAILDLLEEGKGNLMQILQNYDFYKIIDEHNRQIFGSKTKKQIVKELIDEMPPKMRRPVIQAVRIVQELTKVAKQDPDAISIEVTREENGKEKRTELTKKATSRRDQIKEFLNNLVKNDPAEKDRAQELDKELEHIAADDPKRLNGKHLYLYFMQNGRDAYSGEPIDINDVINGTKYDTDHIIPQSLMKDDSLDNLVLVKKEVNQHRSNQYPIPAEIRNNPSVTLLWKRLKKAKMMSEKKYNNLVRGTQLTDNELSDFVAAQINVVNRSNVVIRDVLNILYPNTKLIFSKAKYPSQIRKELQIPKLRDLNDTHHAVDAYLNIVTGVELTNKFGDMRLIKARENGNQEFSLNMENYISRLICSKDGNLTELGQLIDENSRRHDFLLTYRFDYNDNSFYDQTIYNKNETSLIPLHDNMDTSRYGGYSSMSIEFNCIATITGKKTKRYLLGVPHLLMEKYRTGKDINDDLIALVPHKKGECVSINLSQTVSLAVTLRKGGVLYICKSKNKNQVKLEPISPIFLDRADETYLNNMLKYREKYPEIFAKSNEYSFAKDKGNDAVVLNPSLTKQVLLNLVEKAKESKFDYCPMIASLREKTFDELSNACLSDQLNVILESLGVFGRKSEILTDTNFLKSRGCIGSDDIIICSDSITGLYHTERKL